jgi:hypothetical protein
MTDISEEQLGTQLEVMLSMQDALNRVVIPDWLNRNLAWHRAIYVEAAEYLEHLGTWKWWKKGSPDFPQANMELVDIWHFGLSWYLNAYSAKGESFASTPNFLIRQDIRSSKAIEPLSADEQVASEQRHRAVDELVASAGLGSFCMNAFMRLLAYSGMDFDALYQRYVGKNVLNRFRQENGYKTGEYVKVWDGLEDNEHLNKLLADLPADVLLPDRVHAGLTALYAACVKSKT